MDSFLNMSSFNGKEQANKIKYFHLSRENSFLIQTVQELREQILSLRNINQELQQGLTNNTKALINQLTQQNSNLQQSMFRLMKKNEELSCDTLMKSQLLCENQNQTQEILTNYEEKIYQLRMQLQSKENLIKKIEDKYIRDKEDQYGPVSEVNLMYFDQLNELRVVVESVNAENLQLKYLNLQKQEEISKIKTQLNQCQNLLKNSNDYQHYKSFISSNTNTEHTEDKKSEYTLTLCQELKRHDLKFKIFNPSSNDDFALEANKYKVISSQLCHENQKLKKQSMKLAKDLAIKNKQHKTLQQAYEKINSQMQNYQVELQLYRSNFHQFTKVITQRQNQNPEQPKMENLSSKKGSNEKEDTISYWKTWNQLHRNSQNFDGRRVLSTVSQQNKIKRSLSCISKFRYTKTSIKTPNYFSPELEEEILSFNNETQSQNRASQYSHYQSHKSSNDDGIFTEEISSIIRPTAAGGMKNFLKKQFSEMDIEIEC